MPASNGSLYDISAQLLDGSSLSLSHFKGSVLLIVNTASQCGFTPQYTALEQLHMQYHDRGFEVLCFPCNQFGAQEPGTAADIGQFCQHNYRVSFPLFSKIEVNGPGAHPLYQLLKSARPGILGTKRIKWNFTKFLIDRSGQIASRHAPNVDPLRLRPAVEALLNKN